MFLVLLTLTVCVTSCCTFHLPRDVTEQIIGGHDVTDDTKYPWQGSIRIAGKHICGCVLLSTTWSVTAAHCVTTTRDMTLHFGTISLTQAGQTRLVRNLIQHEDYGVGEGQAPNDIAVVKFDAVTLEDTVQPITMATSDHTANTDCHITGWGLTEVGGEPYDDNFPTTLQETRINVLTNKQCRAIWANSINDGHVCVSGDSVKGKAACKGDSGGPLVCSVDGEYQLVGVTSWGIFGCYTFYPSVYSRVSHFRPWIMEKIEV